MVQQCVPKVSKLKQVFVDSVRICVKLCEEERISHTTQERTSFYFMGQLFEIKPDVMLHGILLTEE